MSNGPRKRIVLLGAGHGHLYTLKRIRTFLDRGHELTVIAPDVFWYSGLATGMLGGRYEPGDDQVDIASLVNQSGGRFIRDTAIGLHPKERLIELAGHRPLPYDVLSITLGSSPASLPGDNDDRVYAVKPVRRLWDLRRALESHFAAESPVGALKIVVAGGGQTGCEVAANIAQLAAARNRSIDIVVLTAGSEILADIPRAAAGKVVSALEKRGVAFRCHSAVTHLIDGQVRRADGSKVAYDVFINATGLLPSPTLRSFGLPLDSRGGLVVDECLRSVAAPEIHGAGDCISFIGQPLPSVGVYAIRQAPVLFHNLLAAAAGAQPKKFRPQRRYLSVMNLGDGTGLAVRGQWYWQGKLAFALKNWIDQRFLRTYQSVVRRNEL